VGWEDAHWIHLAQDREKGHAILKTVMNNPDLKQSGNFFSSSAIIRFS
jgi:hypothetical protein